MYRFHPQWQKARELVVKGSIGEVRTLHSFFSYYNTDPENIRNKADIGGGALMDIGCYCISFPRFVFDEEPVNVTGEMDFDPVMKTDRLTSGMLRFPSGKTSTFTCATQLMPYQKVHIMGTGGQIIIEIPVNAPPEETVSIILKTQELTETFTFDPVDQYTLQGDAFSKAIIDDNPVPVLLEDAVKNMQVIDELRAGHTPGHRETGL